MDDGVIEAGIRRACTDAGCTADDGAPCAYVDRRGRICSTAWCPEHRTTIEDQVYCRRHAGVISALPSFDASLAVSLPDLDNRAPSLVGWVSRQIDGDVWRLLLNEASSGKSGQLVADPVTLIYVGITRERAWERAWRLNSHVGITHRVSILVAESDDARVLVQVGSNIVERLVPPWIECRARGDVLAPEGDRKARAVFYQQILDAIGRGLERERNLADSVTYRRDADGQDRQ